MSSTTAFRLRPVLYHAPPRERDRWRRAVAVAPRRQGTRTFVRARPWVNGKAMERLCCRTRPLPTLRTCTVRASNAHESSSSISEADRGADVVYEETFRVKRCVAVEGKVSVKLEWGEEEEGGGRKGLLVVGCNLHGDWTLHWGVTYLDDIASEWDQPPSQMRPAGSVPIKDYAVETPLRKSSSCSVEQTYHELKIYLESSMSVAAIHFVLKDEKTGAWFQYQGRDFRIPLLDYPQQDDANVGRQKNSFLWPSAFSQISSLILKTEEPQLDANAVHDKGANKDIKCKIRFIEGFYKEYEILKEESVENCINVMVKRSEDTNKNQLYIDTDIPGQVVVHWGVCRDNSRTWEIPSSLLPPKSRVFREKAIRTLLQKKENCIGSSGMFSLDKDISGFLFVLKLNEYTWLKNVGGDFFIPFKSESTVYSQSSRDLAENIEAEKEMTAIKDSTFATRNNPIEDSAQTSSEISKGSVVDERGIAYTDGIITEIRNLVTDIASEKCKPTNTKEQENILQEIEKLAAEAYRIFQSAIPNFADESLSNAESVKPPVFSSGTGSGYEILFQGFNWESHKSGRWYTEISIKAAELAKFGFTTVWLPPPTESVSPEGYMPKDLYNLNSRYGNMEELRAVVKKMHEVGIKVLGDVVLNHRCAHYKNKNGIWNIFGGRLNWDEQAIVADDPHYQGKGNKSSGDNFHAAPNIDHSQDFVRKDIKEWLCWLREEIGYDGWRLDFVRGFWGGYVKDYLEASGPYFAVGEYWDSLNYTYGEMDHNQDAHRQRIIDWINATNGTAGAFDATTKGILHAALEKCEYWRLSDGKGKPPGVVGWWPSRAVTFIENHDTGSTQGHWRFPAGKEMQGYAYILTHPGTPTVFCDHMYSHLQQELRNLISLRCKQKIHCRSMVKITKAERDVYAATIDGKLTMKIGPGYYEPPSGAKQWTLSAEGRDYKVWKSS